MTHNQHNLPAAFCFISCFPGFWLPQLSSTEGVWQSLPHRSVQHAACPAPQTTVVLPSNSAWNGDKWEKKIAKWSMNIMKYKKMLLLKLWLKQSFGQCHQLPKWTLSWWNTQSIELGSGNCWEFPLWTKSTLKLNNLKVYIQRPPKHDKGTTSLTITSHYIKEIWKLLKDPHKSRKKNVMFQSKQNCLNKVSSKAEAGLQLILIFFG